MSRARSSGWWGRRPRTVSIGALEDLVGDVDDSSVASPNATRVPFGSTRYAASTLAAHPDEGLLDPQHAASAR